MGAFETCCTICVWAYQIRPKLTGLLMDMASYCADGQGKLLDGRGQAFDDWVISDNIIRIVAANVEAMPCSPGTVQCTGDSFFHSFVHSYIHTGLQAQSRVYAFIGMAGTRMCLDTL